MMTYVKLTHFHYDTELFTAVVTVDTERGEVVDKIITECLLDFIKKSGHVSVGDSIKIEEVDVTPKRIVGKLAALAAGFGRDANFRTPETTSDGNQ